VTPVPRLYHPDDLGDKLTMEIRLTAQKIARTGAGYQWGFVEGSYHGVFVVRGPGADERVVFFGRARGKPG